MEKFYPWHRVLRQSRRWGGIFVLIFGSCLVAAESSLKHRVEDLSYGQALYQYFQQDELAAITRLMAADENPRTRNQQDESDLLLASLYYNYGLYAESEKLFSRLLIEDTSKFIRNQVWFNLSRLNYDQGYFSKAQELLSKIDDRLPTQIEAERQYLLTNLYIGQREYEQARKSSKLIDSNSVWKAYANYNLGVSLLEDGHYESGSVILDQLGQMRGESSEIKALRDQSNLALGLKQLRLVKTELALASISRVRLNSPLSHEALLASGWAWYHLGEYKKALMPWTELSHNNAIDAATQEVLLAMPSSFEKIGRDKQAAQYYEIALNQFNLQLNALDNVIESIRQNQLLETLHDYSFLIDRSNYKPGPPDLVSTPYFHLLFASVEFQTELKRYQELLDMRSSLQHWSNNMPILDLMLAERRKNFQQKLPRLRQSSDFDSLQTLKKTRDKYAKKLSAIASNEDYLALANEEEKEQLERLQKISHSLGVIAGQQNISSQRDMYRMFSGILHWDISTNFAPRVWQARKQLIALDVALKESTFRAGSLRQISEASTKQFDEFEFRINGQESRIKNLKDRVTDFIEQQETLINRLAIAAIEQQRENIIQLRLSAHFSLAKLYDRLAAQ